MMAPIRVHKRIPHGRPRARAGAHTLKRLREVVGRRNGRAHLRHGVRIAAAAAAVSRGREAGSPRVEVARRGQRRGGEAARVRRRRRGEVLLAVAVVVVVVLLVPVVRGSVVVVLGRRRGAHGGRLRAAVGGALPAEVEA